MPNNLGISDEEFERRFDQEIDLDKIPKYITEKKTVDNLSDEELYQKYYKIYVAPLKHDESDYTVSNALDKVHKAVNLHKAERNDDGGWTKHDATYWSRVVNGNRLDYWPSTQKFRINGKTYRGDVYKIIKKDSASYKKATYIRKIKQAEEWERNLVNQPEI